MNGAIRATLGFDDLGRPRNADCADPIRHVTPLSDQKRKCAEKDKRETGGERVWGSFHEAVISPRQAGVNRAGSEQPRVRLILSINPQPSTHPGGCAATIRWVNGHRDNSLNLLIDTSKFCRAWRSYLLRNHSVTKIRSRARKRCKILARFKAKTACGT